MRSRFTFFRGILILKLDRGLLIPTGTHAVHVATASPEVITKVNPRLLNCEMGKNNFSGTPCPFADAPPSPA